MIDPMTCISCGRAIDATSKICPYCGANPVSGAKIDTTPLIESHFPKKQDLSVPESALEFFRHRQWMVVTAVVAVLFSIAFFGHRIIRERNEATAAEVPAVPLTEVADLSGQPAGAERAPIPDLDFQLEGNAKNARMLLVEPGAIAPPPEVVTTTSTTAAGQAPATPARPGAGPRVVPSGFRPPAPAALRPQEPMNQPLRAPATRTAPPRAPAQ